MTSKSLHSDFKAIKPPVGRHRKGHSAFTLSELLVVTAIIAVVFSLLFPMMGSLRGKARNVQCVDHLRQCGAALLLKAADDGNVLRMQSGGSGASGYLWAQYIANSVASYASSKNYSRALDILYCPAYPPYRFDPNYPNFNWTWRTYGAYVVNTAYAKDELLGDASLYKIQLSVVPSPSSHPLLIDSIHAEGHIQRMNIRSHVANAGAGSVHLRHDNRAHIVFLDGHVSAADAAALKEVGFKSAYDKDEKLISF